MDTVRSTRQLTTVLQRRTTAVSRVSCSPDLCLSHPSRNYVQQCQAESIRAPPVRKVITCVAQLAVSSMKAMVVS